MDSKRSYLLVLVSSLGAKSISIDEILAQDKQLKLISTFSYINIHNKSYTLNALPYALPNNMGFVNIPLLGYQNTNEDYLNLSLYARYGISSRLEVFSTLSGFYQHSKLDTNGTFSTHNRMDFSSLNLGTLFLAKKEGKYPSLMLGVSADAMDKTYFTRTFKSLQYFKSYSFFATSYYTSDPIVFLLQAGFRLNTPKRAFGYILDNGEIFTLSPTIYFAVNPYVSLHFGVRYQYQSKDFLNKTALNMQGSTVSYTFGVAYELKHRLIVFGDVEKLDTSLYTSNTISLSISYRI